MNEEEVLAFEGDPETHFGFCVQWQAELFPDKSHGGRVFYNEAIMSAMRIPQVRCHLEHKDL